MMRYILATEMSGQICKRMCQICKRAPWAALQESGHRVAREFPGQRGKRVARPLLQERGSARFKKERPGHICKTAWPCQICKKEARPV